MEAYHYQITGGYHREKGEECQDAVLFRESGRYAVAVAADGVSACENGGIGAALACRAAADFARMEGAGLFEYEPEKLAYLLVEHVLYFLEQAGAGAGGRVSDYASTLAAAFLDTRTGKTVLFNLGDGAIFSLAGSEYRLQAAPRQYRGNPCVTTTKNAYRAAQVKHMELMLGGSLLLCTDGFLHAAGSLPRDAVSKAVRERSYEALNALLDGTGERDDCSYLAVTRTRRNTAANETLRG